MEWLGLEHQLETDHAGKLRYYTQKARDEICEDCLGCSLPDGCKLIRDRFDELITENECEECGILIGPNNRYCVADGMLFCNQDCVERGLL